MDDGTLHKHPSTSIIIPSAGFAQPDTDSPMLRRCLNTLARLNPQPTEILVVVGDEYQADPPQRLSDLPVRVVHRDPGPFDFSRAINRGVLASISELVLFLNDDIEADVEAETSDWLGAMASHLDDPAVGAVGACLLYPDRSIQHIGMEFQDGLPIHSCRGYQLSEAAAVVGAEAHDVASVTGACLLTRRKDFLAVGGMSLEFPSSYGDVDFCLRLKRAGKRIVIEPAATLIHHESASREPVIEHWEQERFSDRWGTWELYGSHSNQEGEVHGYDSPMTADSVDGQDLEELRHEILRLRDQALGAEAQKQHLRDRIANSEDRIAELERRITERDTDVAEWKDRVAERDTRIAERDQRIAERDAKIEEHDQRIAERDQRIAERDAKIEESTARVAERDARITSLEEENSRLHEDLARPVLIRILRKLRRK